MICIEIPVVRLAWINRVYRGDRVPGMRLVGGVKCHRSCHFHGENLVFFLGVGEAYVQRREHVLGQQKSQRFSGEQKGIPYVN